MKKFKRENKRMKSILLTGAIVAIFSGAATASADSIQTTVSMSGVVTGSLPTGDYDAAITQYGTLSAKTDGTFETVKPTVIEVAHNSDPATNKFSDLDITLDSVQVTVDSIYVSGATVDITADGNTLTAGTAHSLLAGGSEETVVTSLAASGTTGAAISPGQTVNTTANLTFVVTY
ncbi:hypothetical protein [Vibrio owensii]|uniref:hypothetical protein n=1 Tax=Vibrio owensii TaxID=696485 RepID=UPI0005876E20|nr:hypothetical protein [Vibrio owensii]